MDQPAQTLNYLIAGYVVIFTGLFGYILSLVVRWKKSVEQKELLEKSEK
jgi:CcmD family protein